MTRRTWVLLALTLLAAGALSLFASSSPDGLERVLEDYQIGVPAPAGAAPLPDYQVPFLRSPALSGSLAGILGAALALGAAWGAFRLLAASGRRRGSDR